MPFDLASAVADIQPHHAALQRHLAAMRVADARGRSLGFEQGWRAREQARTEALAALRSWDKVGAVFNCLDYHQQGELVGQVPDAGMDPLGEIFGVLTDGALLA